ncbi:MAG: iron transporter [Haloplanus sp.]
MHRRDALAAVGSAVLGGTAGCTRLLGTRTRRAPPLVEDRPAAVYVPTHVEGMSVVDVVERGGYRCALAYTYPHRFWLLKPDGRSRVDIAPDDSVHLMPVVWDAATGIVPPDVSPQLTVTRDRTSVTRLAPWPMLSQPMGFHFGDNVTLPGEGTYRVAVRIGSPSTRRTGALAENRGDESFEFDFAFSKSALEDIPYRDVPAERQGRKGAVDPMDVARLPSTQVPDSAALPGDVRGTGTSGDAEFVVTVVDDATRFGGSEAEVYLAVSPRTPYNRYMLPLMSLAGTLTRGGTTAFDGILQSTLDPDLGYHYGAAVSEVAAGDDLTVRIQAPPQAARHEGYETAFVEMAEVQFAL